MGELQLIPYIPSTGSYKIIYPEHFLINEDDDLIVTITSPETYSNLTITGYQASSELDGKVLSEFFIEFTEGYIPVSNLIKEISNKRLYLEQMFKKDMVNWVWWILAEENQIIVISVNSSEDLSSNDYNLYKYMIDQMVIYPSAFDE